MARNHGWLDHLALRQSGSIPTYALLPNSLWRSRAKTILFDTGYSVGTLITTFKLDSQNDSLKSFMTQHFYKLTG